MSSTRSFTSAVVPTTSSAIFTFILDVVVFVFMIFLMGIMIANIVYFRRFASDSGQTHISHTAAVSMVGISIFLLIVTIIGLIYYGFLVIYNFFMVFQSMDSKPTVVPAAAVLPAGVVPACTPSQLSAAYAQGLSDSTPTVTAPLSAAQQKQLAQGLRGISGVTTPWGTN